MFMLALPYNENYVQYPCYVQPKLNGIRAQSLNGEYWSRNSNIWPAAMTAHLPKLPPNITFDGEFYKHGWNLQQIVSAMGINRDEPTELTREVEYWAFDIVELGVKQSTRLEQLYLMGVNALDITVIANKDEADRQYGVYVGQGFEGMIYRKLDGIYVNGRTKGLLKRKNFQDEEVAVVGFQPGQGKYEGYVGALVCERNWITFEVGTGMTDEQRVEWTEKLPKRIKIKYIALSSDGKPLNASVL